MTSIKIKSVVHLNTPMDILRWVDRKGYDHLESEFLDILENSTRDNLISDLNYAVYRKFRCFSAVEYIIDHVDDKYIIMSDEYTRHKLLEIQPVEHVYVVTYLTYDEEDEIIGVFSNKADALDIADETCIIHKFEIDGKRVPTVCEHCGSIRTFVPQDFQTCYSCILKFKQETFGEMVHLVGELKSRRTVYFVYQLLKNGITMTYDKTDAFYTYRSL